MFNQVNVVVLGSFNMDYVMSTERQPYPGETIKSNKLQNFPGGKGNNQAIALGKLGTNVAMLGCLGTDENGEILTNNLNENGVKSNYIIRVDEKTGLAFINAFSGENTIILHSGANDCCTISNIEGYVEIIKNSRILLTQMEIPFETTKWALKIARENGVLTIFNPAPAAKLDDEIWRYIDIIITNELECKTVLGIDEKDNVSYELIIKRLLEKGIGNVVITKGANGIIYNNKEEILEEASIKVDVVDTTGAGDAFIGGFTNAISKGLEIGEAVKYGNKLASIKIGYLGAQNYEVSEGFFNK
jgi:ribokinase